MTDAERTSLYRVAYEEAVRALAGQQVLIESLRARAGLLLSTAAVTTSFLGSQALDGGGASAIAWVALVVFAAAAAACLAVLWPRSWEFAVGPRAIIHSYIESPEPAAPSELLGDLMIHVSAGYARNKPNLETLGDLLQLGGILLSFDVALWIVAVAIGG